MSFADAIRTCLTKYADFSGRGRRSEYWYFWLFTVLVNIVLSIVLGAIHLTFISYLVSLALIVPSVAAAVRRLHDTGRSGWWLLIAFIPLVGAIILIVFLATDTNSAGDTYGPSPKAVAYGV